MRITVRQLEVFAAICQEQTVTGASRKIGLSQAATSQALAELENLLERKLFDRHGRRIVLNAAGRQLLPAAVQVLDRVRDIETAGAPSTAHIKLCASLTTGNYMLPSIISRFARLHPGCQFHVALGNTDQVVESLLQFESDAGWIEGLVQHQDLQAFPWREDELVIVAKQGHRLASHHATPEDLAAAAWILREKGSGTRAVFEDAIAGKFRLEHVPIEFGGIEAIKHAVLAGAGLGCISRSAVAPELKTGQLRRVHASWLNLRRQLTVLIHREKYLDTGLRGFLSYAGVTLTAG
ncbi:MAG TPA: LysR substrate-binding domain-containing protein [Bryobacteraceae bacterium]|nr:LysR substrate-binding domain-containing protein [Bryobacteraceae bacterium]